MRFPDPRTLAVAFGVGISLIPAIAAASEAHSGGQAGSLSMAWAVRLGTPRPDLLYGMDIGADGEITVGGVFSTTLELGDFQITSRGRGQDGFVARLGPDGSAVWLKGFGGERDDTLSAIAVAPDGRVMATGQYSGTSRFHGESEEKTIESTGLTDMFVFVIDKSGFPLWTRTLGGKYGDAGRALAAAPDGGLFLAGQFQLGADFGRSEGKAVTLTSRGSMDVALLRVDGSGDPRWVLQLGGDGPDTVAGIAGVDGGGLVATGTFHESAAVGETAMEGLGSSDLYLLHVDADGTVQWVRTFGNEKPDSPGKVATAADGSIVYAGNLQGAWELDDASVASAGASDLVVICWNRVGELQWLRRFGGEHSETTDALAIGPEGKIYLAGSFTKATEIGDYRLESPDSDSFVVVLHPDGEIAGLHHFPAKGVERIMALGVPSGDEVVIGGVFQDEFDPGGIGFTSRGKSDIFIARLRLP